MIICYTLVKVGRGDLMDRNSKEPNNEFENFNNNNMNLHDKYDGNVDNPFFEDSDDIEILTLEEDKEVQEVADNRGQRLRRAVRSDESREDLRSRQLRKEVTNMAYTS